MPPKNLPSVYKGNPIEVALLTDAQRRTLGLSWSGSIIEIVGRTAEADAVVREACDYAVEQGTITVDTETAERPEFADDEWAALDPYKGKIVLVQIGDASRQYLLWWQTLSDAAKQMVRVLWADKTIRKVGVNHKFDAKMFLGNMGLHWRGQRLVDCQIIDQLIGCGLLGSSIGLTMKNTGMAAMAKRWLGWVLPKDEDIRTGWGAMTPGKWHMTRAEYERAASDGMIDVSYEEHVRDGLAKRHYAADDCVVPIKILHKQAPWLTELGLIETMKLEMEFLPVLAEQEVRGLPINWTEWEVLANEALEARRVAQERLDALFEVEVTYRVDMAGTIEVSRDKNYGSKDEIKDLIRNWMFERYGVEVVGSNKIFKEACLRAGIHPMRVEKLFEKKLVPNPKKQGKNMQVGYPNMVDYIEGSDNVDSLWERMKKHLPENSFPMPTTDSKFLKLLKILHETPDEKIDHLPSIPTKLGLPPELVDPLLAFREANTRLSRYAFSWKSIINPVTGRIHTDTTQTAADTGRLTTSPNFQNLPGGGKIGPRYRAAACRARPGYKIVGADFSQIEPRIIGEGSGCQMYMRVFWSEKPGTPGFDYWCGPDVTEPLDLYGAVGATIGVMPTEGAKKSVAKDKGNIPVATGRKKSKITVLGLGYGTGEEKFHIQYILDTGEYHPRSESDKLFQDFWSAAEEVKKYLDQQSALAYPGPDTRYNKRSPRAVWHPFTEDRTTWSESLGGRKRYFDPDSPQWWTQGRNHPIQSTGADILKRTCVELAEWLWNEGIDGFIILTAHDELVLEVIEHEAERVQKKMEEIMGTVGERYCPHVPITADGYVADFWVKD